MAPQILFSILSIALLGQCISADNNEGLIDFGYYDGPNGPDKWGSLHPSSKACSNGKAQSPVDIRKANIVLNKQLRALDDGDYCRANATLVNEKSNIGVHFEGEAGGININGKLYHLKQLHWHIPSEHRINGRQYDAEVHFVHKTKNGSIAVVGVLYKVGVNDDPIICKIQDKLVQLDKESRAGLNKKGHVALGTFDIAKTMKRSNRYYRYAGSLTTPPCNEGVIWSILAKPRSVSRKQVQLLWAPLSPQFKNNARPVQPLNGRKIDMHYRRNRRDVI